MDTGSGKCDSGSNQLRTIEQLSGTVEIVSFTYNDEGDLEVDEGAADAEWHTDVTGGYYCVNCKWETEDINALNPALT